MFSILSLGIFQGLGLIVFILVFWDLFWRGMALWKAGRANQNVWFIALLIINTAGILPIIYLLFFQKAKKIGKK